MKIGNLGVLRDTCSSKQQQAATAGQCGVTTADSFNPLASNWGAAYLQECDVRLADWHIIWCCVVMQLLMPLFHPGALLLGNVVPAGHIIQYL